MDVIHVIKLMFLNQRYLSYFLILGVAMNSMVFAEQRVTIRFWRWKLPIVNDTKNGNYASISKLIRSIRKIDTNTFSFLEWKLGAKHCFSKWTEAPHHW